MVLIGQSHISQSDESFNMTREDDDADEVYSDIVRFQLTFAFVDFRLILLLGGMILFDSGVVIPIQPGPGENQAKTGIKK